MHSVQERIHSQDDSFKAFDWQRLPDHLSCCLHQPVEGKRGDEEEEKGEGGGLVGGKGKEGEVKEEQHKVKAKEEQQDESEARVERQGIGRRF